ncbi:hypothetical protein V5N11_023350 [Cardamine amara subsp. amara]|uniref:Uncharacterized protein n=1 Tax=Cardamine amara subsp. amara TaxID=228776 RepID=A0ABD1AYS6_CARAN
MAKIYFVLLIVVLIAFLHVSEANRSIDLNEGKKEKNSTEGGLEEDLHQAKDLIEKDVKEKETNIKKLEKEVSMLTKSEAVLDQLGDAYRNGKSFEPYEKKLKKFNRRIKKAHRQVKYGSIIQNILQDLGLNRGIN